MPRFIDIDSTLSSAASADACASIGVQRVANVVGSGATGNGTTDDTTAIHAACTAAGVGGTVYFPAGTYLVDGLTASVAGQVWELSSGATIKMKATATAALTVSGENVTVTGGTFDCSSATLHDWSQQGIRVTGDGVTIRNTVLTDSPKHGVYVLDCSRFTATGCTITDSWDNGIFVQHGDLEGKVVDDIQITDNTITSSSDYASGIAVRGNSTSRLVKLIKISRNTVSIPYDQTQTTAGVSVTNGVDALVEGNLIAGGYFGITNPDVKRSTISNNVIKGFRSQAIEIPGAAEHTVVSGNVIDADGTAAQTGIVVGSGGTAKDLAVLGNTFTGFAGPAYPISFSANSAFIENASVVGNTFAFEVSSGQFNALYSAASVTNLVFSNNVVDAASTANSYGLNLLGAATTGVIITGNQFSNLATRVVNLSTASSGTFDHIRFAGNLVRNCAEEVGGSALAGATNLTTDSDGGGSPSIVGPAYYPPGYLSGNYYYCNSVQSSATSNALGNGTIRLSPWVVTAPITVTKMLAEFTAAGDANSVFRIGVWQHNTTTGKPNVLILDAGTISTGTGDAGTVATGGTPGVYELTVSKTIEPGVYWVGGAVQGVTSVQPTMRCIDGNTVQFLPTFGTSKPGAGTAPKGWAVTNEFGAFVSMSGGISISSLASVRVGFKVT